MLFPESCDCSSEESDESCSCEDSEDDSDESCEDSESETCEDDDDSEGNLRVSDIIFVFFWAAHIIIDLLETNFRL